MVSERRINNNDLLMKRITGTHNGNYFLNRRGMIAAWRSCSLSVRFPALAPSPPRRHPLLTPPKITPSTASPAACLAWVLAEHAAKKI
jgi:hypothetical protein